MRTVVTLEVTVNLKQKAVTKGPGGQNQRQRGLDTSSYKSQMTLVTASPRLHLSLR